MKNVQCSVRILAQSMQRGSAAQHSVGITARLSPKGPKEGNSTAVKNAVKQQTFRLVSQNFSGGEKTRLVRRKGVSGNEWLHV